MVDLATPSASANTVPTPVVVIVMENHSINQIVGSVHAPYLNNQFIPSGTLFTNYAQIAQSSLPNYIAMTSGSTQGCESGCLRNSISADNLFKQLDTSPIGWQAFEESMPKNCDRSNALPYVVRHNPPPYYISEVGSGQCAVDDIAYPDVLPVLQPFTFVTPNDCNDMHSCTIATGDTWLSNHVPSLLATGAIVIITFDEGTKRNPHVMTAISGPGVTAGVTDSTAYDHYSLLAGLENHYVLPLLLNAQTATPLPIPA
jgi:hypothetical protein